MIYFPKLFWFLGGNQICGQMFPKKLSRNLSGAQSLEDYPREREIVEPISFHCANYQIVDTR